MPQQRSTLEILIPEKAIPEQVGPLRIRPVVVDSSFLVSDILASMASGRRSTFLDAVEFGVIRPYAAHHVWAEMGRNVRDVPLRHGLDADFAEQVWWQLYVPRMRFVDTAQLEVPTVSVEIFSRDSSDSPTIALAGLLSPVVVLATDRDLRDLGVATQNYKAVMSHAGTLTVISQGAWGSLVAFSLIVGLIGQVGKGIATILRHPIGQLGAAVGASALLVTSDRWYPATREHGFVRWQALEALLSERALPFLADLFGSYELAISEFEAASYEAEGSALPWATARALASSAHPLTRTQLAKVLFPNDTEAERRRVVRELLPVLQANDVFCEHPRARWDLGRASVDFGRADPSPRELLQHARPSLPVRSVGAR